MGRFVYHLTDGVSMPPNTAGIDEWLATAGERTENSVDGRTVDAGMVGCAVLMTASAFQAVLGTAS